MKKWLTRSIFALLICISILTCEKNPTSIVIPFPQKIAYIPYDDFQLYLVDANGKNLQRLTDFEIGTIQPPEEYPNDLAWSPNRNIIAYSTVYDKRGVLDDDSSFIYTVDNNKKISKIVKLKRLIKDLSFSPDGQKLLYTVSSFYVYDGARICVANIDGSDQRFITPMPSHPESFAYDPCWSPDGSQIAFISYEDSAYHVSLVSAFGGMITHLTSNSKWIEDLGWSSDGRKIVFSSWREGETFGIYVMNSDGSNLKRISDGRTPEWSPDGSKIVFCTPSGAQVCTINADGSDYRQLTPGGASYYEPTWFPDGRNIAYVKGYPTLDIYTTNISSGKEIRVTDMPWASGGFIDYEISPVSGLEQ